MSKLLPCPFCGCTDITERVLKDGGLYISCDGCRVGTPRNYTGTDLHKTKWNTRQSSEWVSVEDRLPDKEDFVYFCTDSGGVGMGHIDDHGICTVNYLPLRALGEVTHWMPLPQPPITESDDD